MTVELTTTSIQEINEKTNLTTINLGKCGDYLKEIYNIPRESNLYILKVDKKQENKNYPLIEYEVYYPIKDANNSEKMEKLNLSFCDGINIDLFIPIIINDTIYKYDPKSDYYNDICFKSTSENNIDIPLSVRKNEFIKNNMALCEENCELTSYDSNTNKAKCSCNAKNEISFNKIELDTKDLLRNFFNIKKISNIEVIKCYKTVFKFKNLMINYGFFIILFIFLLYFICMIIFYCKSLKKLINEIRKIIIYKMKDKEKISVFNINKNKNKRSLKNKLENLSTFQKIQKKSSVIFLNNNFNHNNDKELNKEKKNKNILDYTDSELNSFSYKEALKKDSRTYIQYYCSILKKKHSFLFSFYPVKDYNSQVIKIFLFCFFYSSDIALNALFFTDDTMNKIYDDSGSYNLNYQLPQIVYSFLVSNVINFIIGFLSLSEDIIISIKEIKNDIQKIAKKKINSMEMKFCFFFFITFFLLFIFLFYVSCFCCIYQNTQIHLIKDSLISLGLSFIYPFFICLIPGVFRIPALSSLKENKSCLYKFSQFLENILL